MIPGPGRSRSAVGGAALAALAVLLLAIQLHVLPTLKIEAAARGLPGTPGSLLAVLRSPARADLIGPPILAAALLLVLALLQWRRRTVSGLFLMATSSWRGSLLVALGLSALLTRYYLDPGLLHQFDAKLHTMQSAEAGRILGGGGFPDWSFTFYDGYPFLRFRGLLLYVGGGATGLILGDVTLALKLLLWAAHIGCAWAVFSLARELGGDRRGALLAAVASAISFQHTHGVVLAGRLPVGLLYLLFPLLLREAERMAKRPSPAVGLKMGVYAALMVLTHPGLASYGVTAAVLWLATRLVARRVGLRTAVRSSGALILAGLTAAMLTAFLVVPALIESETVHIHEMYATAGFDLSLAPDVGQITGIFAWTNAWTGDSVTYVGLSLLGLFAFGLFRKKIPGEVRAALAVTGLALLFLTGGSYLSARSVHYFVVVAAVGAGLAASHLPDRRMFWLLLILLVDLGPTTIQSPCRPDLEYDRQFMHRAAARSGGERAIRVSVRDGNYSVSQWASIYDSGQPVITGPFREAAGRTMYPLMLDLLERLEADLNAGGGLSDRTLIGLRAFGVRRLLFEDGTRPVLPDLDDPALVAEPSLPALLVERSGPAVAVLSDEARIRFAWGWETLRAREDSGVRARDLAVGPKDVRFEVDADKSGSLLLAFTRLPGLTVRLDGRPVQTHDGPYGLTAIDVDQGEHSISLSFESPGYLRTSRGVSLVALLLLVASALFLIRRRR